MLDANLAILLVAGAVDPTLPARHKRLQNFGARDYARLAEHAAGYDEVVFTPNVLTEVSNLVVQGLVDPLKTQILIALRKLIAEAVERYVPSSIAAGRPEFVRLGLTDAGLLEALADGEILLTDDDALYVAASSTGRLALNFKHFRVEY